MICPICSNDAPYRLSKGIVKYYQCSSCKTLFCGELDNSSKIGGGFEIERNQTQNHLRIARIDEMSFGMAKEDVFILDFGCGHAYLIEDLKKAGYPNVDGYDAYYEKYSRLPEKNKYNIVICVEVAEHLSSPFVEFDVMHRALKKGGAVVLETGCLNAAWEDGIKDEDNPYINPDAGHSTIYTHHGLDVLFLKKSFEPIQHFNRHVRAYLKLEKSISK